MKSQLRRVNSQLRRVKSQLRRVSFPPPPHLAGGVEERPDDVRGGVDEDAVVTAAALVRLALRHDE
eukprot:374832-Pyramimonas_sp.AAC.2